MSRGWVIIKRIGRILKFALICAILAVCILLLWRVFSTGIPDEIEALSPNKELCELYERQGEDIYMFNQAYDEITRSEHANGYFAVPEITFIPEINQAQLVFRYNNSTVKHLSEDYKLETIPDRYEDLFDVSMVFYIDLTPDDSTDNEDKIIDGKPNPNIKKVRFLPTDDVKSERTTLYSFYRYTFNLVSEEGDTLSSLMNAEKLISVHTEFYYNEDKNYDENPYGALSVYDARRPLNRVDLRGCDEDAFEDYRG